MRLNIGIVITLLALPMLGRGGYGQNCQNGAGQPPPPLTKQNAANHWRFVPVDPAKQTDTVDYEVRKARTAFWENLINSMEVPCSVSGMPGLGAYLMSAPEFPKAQGELWATGKFLNYKVFPLPSICSAYTEIEFLVGSVISPNPPAGLAAGKVIAINMLGGTLLECGQPVSYLLSPRPYSLKPGHSYLIQTYFHSTGDFYSDPRSWDISNGTVEPNDPGEAAREKMGTSQIDGTPASQIVSRMKAILVAR